MLTQISQSTTNLSTVIKSKLKGRNEELTVENEMLKKEHFKLHSKIRNLSSQFEMIESIHEDCQPNNYEENQVKLYKLLEKQSASIALLEERVETMAKRIGQLTTENTVFKSKCQTYELTYERQMDGWFKSKQSLDLKISVLSSELEKYRKLEVSTRNAITMIENKLCIHYEGRKEDYYLITRLYRAVEEICGETKNFVYEIEKDTAIQATTKTEIKQKATKVKMFKKGAKKQV